MSVFNGPTPQIRTFEDAGAESMAVAEWLRQRAKDGVAPHEMAVFVRSVAEQARAQQAVDAAKLQAQVLDDRADVVPGKVVIGTMHLAKGLEFRAVAVMACDDEVIPSPARIAAVTDDGDLEYVYNTERHLLYVACTRARDRLWISGVKPASEFLDDLITRAATA